MHTLFPKERANLGTTVGYSADYENQRYKQLHKLVASGPDAAFRIELDPNETLTASLDSGVSGTTWDAALYLITTALSLRRHV